MPVEQPLPQLSDAYVENSRWLMEHLGDIVREHPNQWVAVHNGRVIAAADDLGVVTATAAQVAPASDTVFQFVDDGSHYRIETSHRLVEKHELRVEHERPGQADSFFHAAAKL